MKSAALAILIFASSLGFACTQMDQKVSMKAKQITTAQAINEISQKAGVKITVAPDITLNKKISIAVQNADLKDVLDFLADELGAMWEGDGKNVTFSAAL